MNARRGQQRVHRLLSELKDKMKYRTYQTLKEAFFLANIVFAVTIGMTLIILKIEGVW